MVAHHEMHSSPASHMMKHRHIRELIGYGLSHGVANQPAKKQTANRSSTQKATTKYQQLVMHK